MKKRLMLKIANWYRSLPGVVKNKYFLTFAIFSVWMLFFDRNDIFSQYKERAELNELEEKRDFYQAEIVKVRADKDELFSSDEELEKFARENYLMKRDNEDIFLVVEDE